MEIQKTIDGSTGETITFTFQGNDFLFHKAGNRPAPTALLPTPQWDGLSSLSLLNS
ncbi:hypothetical protein EYF80_065937 [Liparis tanakae]|uniref:Uncharacterized protein n=1 Tax=Liparis tanakae TaxID=230148 RepID=A0A4Z2E599_9TELE|nr:hypothetical protein EYF80_065937 [Liparis tanakae]